MIVKCPGQDGRKITADSIGCPACRAQVEIFSDELRRRCPQCGSPVTRVKLPSCADWCKAAKDCIGEERF